MERAAHADAAALGAAICAAAGHGLHADLAAAYCDIAAHTDPLFRRSAAIGG